MGSIDLHYRGSDWDGLVTVFKLEFNVLFRGIKWMTQGPQYTLQYLQSLSKYLSVGGELIYFHKQSATMYSGKTISTLIL